MRGWELVSGCVLSPETECQTGGPQGTRKYGQKNIRRFQHVPSAGHEKAGGGGVADLQENPGGMEPARAKGMKRMWRGIRCAASTHGDLGRGGRPEKAPETNSPTAPHRSWAPRRKKERERMRPADVAEAAGAVVVPSGPSAGAGPPPQLKTNPEDRDSFGELSGGMGIPPRRRGASEDPPYGV